MHNIQIITNFKALLKLIFNNVFSFFLHYYHGLQYTFKNLIH